MEHLVQLAIHGDREALEQLLGDIRPKIYNYALKMLWHPADAEDATQEILIRLITHLGSFRGESQFSTWWWRIATNQLLTTRKRRAEQHTISFEEFGLDLDHDLADQETSLEKLEDRLLVEEVKVGCMQGMLLCLNRQERATYIVGEIMELTDREGGAIFEITSATFRKRLSRVRERLHNFTSAKCGLVNPENPCRCGRRIDAAIQHRRVDPDHLLFARNGETQELRKSIEELEQLCRTVALYQSHSEYPAPETLVEVVKKLLDSEGTLLN